MRSKRKYDTPDLAIIPTSREVLHLEHDEGSEQVEASASESADARKGAKGND